MRRRASTLALGWVAAVFFVGTLAIVSGAGGAEHRTDGFSAGLTAAADVVHDGTTVALAPTKVAGLRPLLLVAIVAAAVAVALGRRTTWLGQDADIARQTVPVPRAADPRAPPTRAH
jgi:hypothetical protein